VGRDAKMHDLLVLLSTLGGLGMFGLVGFIIGPIVAALFVTAWRLYGAAFQELLPVPAGAAAGTAAVPGGESGASGGEADAESTVQRPRREGVAGDRAADDVAPNFVDGLEDGVGG